MQVEMANVGADKARMGVADLGVHVCTIHINLAAMLVDCIDNLADMFFKNTVRGRIGNHYGCQLICIGSGFISDI